jgi:hypothetical protein
MLLDNSAKTQLPSLKSIIKSSIEEEEEWSKNTANYIKSCSTAAAAFIKDERPKESEGVKQERALIVTEQTTQVVALSTFLDVDTASAINVITNGGSLELENKVDILSSPHLKLVLMRLVFSD